jgi:quinol monooxygenase YgiN
MSISFIIKFKAKVESQVDFHNVMTNVKSELPDIEGCTGVIVHQSSQDVTSYVIMETWESKEFHERHVEGLVSSGMWENIVTLLSENPVGDYYKLM